MDCIYYKKGFKYQLTDTYRIKINIKPLEPIHTDYIDLSSEGWLTIRKGYAWDGPSGPTKFIVFLLELIPFIGEWLARKFIEKFMRGALVHDVIYQLIRQGYLPGHYRLYADQLLRDICLEDGMSKVRAWWVYKGVRWGAGFAADPSNKKKVITAP